MRATGESAAPAPARPKAPDPSGAFSEFFHGGFEASPFLTRTSR